jgi:hypothetical protein
MCKYKVTQKKKTKKQELLKGPTKIEEIQQNFMATARC